MENTDAAEVRWNINCRWRGLRCICTAISEGRLARASSSPCSERISHWNFQSQNLMEHLVGSFIKQTGGMEAMAYSFLQQTHSSVDGVVG